MKLPNTGLIESIRTMNQLKITVKVIEEHAFLSTKLNSSEDSRKNYKRRQAMFEQYAE